MDTPGRISADDVTDRLLKAVAFHSRQLQTDAVFTKRDRRSIEALLAELARYLEWDRKLTRTEWTNAIVAAVRDGRPVNAWPITKKEFAELIVRGLDELQALIEHEIRAIDSRGNEESNRRLPEVRATEV